MTECLIRGQNSDAFTFRPLSLLLPVSILEVMLLIFEPGGLLGSPLFWLAMLMLFLSTLVLLIGILIALFRARWKRLLSIILAGLVSFAAMSLCLFFQDEIHFQIMRPFYLHEIAQSKDVTRMTWEWKGGSGWEDRLVFDRSGEGLGKGIKGQDNCKISIRQMGEHFYLQSVTC